MDNDTTCVALDCHRCNHALGNVRDNPDTLARMIEYLAEGTISTRSAR